MVSDFDLCSDELTNPEPEDRDMVLRQMALESWPRLTWDNNVSDTSPVVQGTWVTADHVVKLIVDGWIWSDILRTHPELEVDDIHECLAYAAGISESQHFIEGNEMTPVPPVTLPKYIVDGKDMRAKVLIGDRYIHPTRYEMDRCMVAYRLNDERVICPSCAIPLNLVELDATGIYPTNIIPYSQNCHECDRDIVQGWPCQLYDNPNPLQLTCRCGEVCRRWKDATHYYVGCGRCGIFVAHKEQNQLAEKWAGRISLDEGAYFSCICGDHHHATYSLSRKEYWIGCKVAGGAVIATNLDALREQWNQVMRTLSSKQAD
jgi:uncharacterized protein (DUF433 family)